MKNRFYFLILILLTAALLLPSCGQAGNETTGAVQSASQGETTAVQSGTTTLPVPSGTGEVTSGSSEAGVFSIYVMDLGKADCIVLKTENHMMIVDLGLKEQAERIVNFISSIGKKADALLITHYDKDHIGAVKKALNKIDVKEVYLPEYEDEKPENAEEVKGYIARHNITPRIVTEEISFEFDNVSFTLYPTSIFFKRNDNGSNESSLVLRAVHNENVFLFAGDAEARRLPEILSQIPEPSSVDWLKVPHHGDYDANSEEFFTSLSPDYAVITCSKAEPADGSTTAILERIGAKVYCTYDGIVRTVSDGKTIVVTNGD